STVASSTCRRRSPRSTSRSRPRAPRARSPSAPRSCRRRCECPRHGGRPRRSSPSPSPPQCSLGRRLPEVGLDHALVLLDLLRRALSDLLAVVEHRHAVRNPHHHLHVVLDQEASGRPPLGSLG